MESSNFSKKLHSRRVLDTNEKTGEADEPSDPEFKK